MVEIKFHRRGVPMVGGKHSNPMVTLISQGVEVTCSCTPVLKHGTLQFCLSPARHYWTCVWSLRCITRSQHLGVMLRSSPSETLRCMWYTSVYQDSAYVLQSLPPGVALLDDFPDSCRSLNLTGCSQANGKLAVCQGKNSILEY